jgi:hypothetical protein
LRLIQSKFSKEFFKEFFFVCFCCAKLNFKLFSIFIICSEIVLSHRNPQLQIPLPATSDYASEFHEASVQVIRKINIVVLLASQHYTHESRPNVILELDNKNGRAVMGEEKRVRNKNTICHYKWEGNVKIIH